MKKQKSLTFILSFFLLLTITNVYSESVVTGDLTFSSAISLSLDQLEKSPYKSLEVQTVSGSFSGDFVSKTNEVLVLKSKTDSVHMSSGKEKIILTYIDISKIIAISVYVLGD